MMTMMTPTVGQHVVFTHKGRCSYCIVQELLPGMFGEPRAKLQYVSGDVFPLHFPVCVGDLEPDTGGVVAACLRRLRMARGSVKGGA